MPVVRPIDAVAFATHGSHFLSYISPSRGSSQLCAWHLTVPADLRGVPHRPTREEVLFVLDGELHVTLDGQTSALSRGDVLAAQSCSAVLGVRPGGRTPRVSSLPVLAGVTADPLAVDVT